MKKIIFVLFASLLVLSACGNDESKEEKKTEQKEKKSEKKENKKEEKSTEEKQASNTTQSPSQENVTVNDEQQTTVGYNQSQNNQGNANLNGDVVAAPGWTEQQQQSEYEKYKQGQQEQIENGVDPGSQITYEEQMKANAEVAKQHGYTGIPNGDMMSTDKMDQFAREVIEEQN